MNALAKALLEQQQPATRVLYGVATDVNTVTIAGSTVAVELPAITPVVAGDYVAVLASGADRLILGPVERQRGAAFKVATTVSIPVSTNTAITWSEGLWNTAWRDSGDNTRIIVPADGVYAVAVSLSYNSMTAGTRMRALISKNGTAFSIAEHLSATSGSINAVGVASFAADDYVSVVAFHNDAAARNLNGYTNLSIRRVE